MAWFRVDDQAAFHPKVVRAGNAAFGAWVRFGAYCNAQLTDGFVPEQVARLIAAKRDIDGLIAAGLLHLADGGYEIHDYHDFQPASEDVKQRRADVSAKRSEAGRAGGKASGESRRSKGPPNSEATGKQLASTAGSKDEAPSRPVPSEEQVIHTHAGARVMGATEEGAQQMALLGAWEEADLPGSPGMWTLATELRKLPEPQRMTPAEVMTAYKRLVAKWTRGGLTMRVTVENLVKNLSLIVQIHRGELVPEQPAPAHLSAANDDNRPHVPVLRPGQRLRYGDE